MTHCRGNFRRSAFASALAVAGTLPATGHAELRLGFNERVNTTTAGRQYSSDIARDAIGNTVVVWVSNDQDGDGSGIFGQRYAADGRALGEEFAINTRTTGDQRNPRVAMSATGRFVVTWAGPDPDGDGVHVRRYNAQGAALGDQVRVNGEVAGYQVRPDVAMDAAGNFTVIWTGPGAEGAAVDVFQRRFAADGTPLGDQRRVNKATAYDQDYATIAMDADGDAVIAWENYEEPLGEYTVFYRRFDSTGAARDTVDVRVAVTGESQQSPAAAMDATGGFVIAWCDSFYVVPEPPEHYIYARRFAAGGNPRDADPLVVRATAARVLPWAVATDATGDTVVTWREQTSPTSSDSLVRVLGADGAFDTASLRVNTNTTRLNDAPSVAVDADGDFVVSWTTATAGSDDSNVLRQRFRSGTSVNLALRQNDAPDPSATGAEIRYTLRGSNLNPTSDLDVPLSIRDALGAATGVTLVDRLPDNATFVSAKGTGWTCRLHAPDVICDNRRPVRAGDSMEPVVLTVAAPDAAGTLTNHASLSADQRDGRPANNDADETTTLE
ncbi:MAG TPA: hypothetical protein VJM11_12600 [Nevskiaceae bacterium]|nr:hypothetical protein [Nevskiaceae bacterium]